MSEWILTVVFLVSSGATLVRALGRLCSLSPRARVAVAVDLFVAAGCMMLAFQVGSR